MAATVEGATIVGTTSKGMPMVKGSNNLIKINIDTPIEIDLNSFKENILPYLDGDNNVVNIEIIGADNFIEDITVNGEKMTIIKKSMDGEIKEEINLPNCKDGQIDYLTWIANSSEINGKWTEVIGVDGEPMKYITNDIKYNVITNDLGQILTISKG